MSVEISPPFRVFTDVDGEPLEDGYIYVGAVNQNPQAVPISVFWDAALTIPAAQPIRTLGGYPSRSGTPSRMYVAESAYSISVLNKNSTLVYSDLNNTSGDPALRQELALDTLPTTGGDIVGISRRNGLTGRTVQDFARETLSINDFFIPGQADWTLGLQAARDYLAGFPGKPPALEFVGGEVYDATIMPNWAIPNVILRGNGATLRNTGAGDNLILDAGAGAERVFFVSVEGFFLEGDSSSGHGVFVRSVHHSYIQAEVRGCGTVKNALQVNFAVCTRFDVTASINRGAWYLGAQPQRGIVLAARTGLEAVTACTFINPVIEGMSAQGILLTDADTCWFQGGTSEANAGANVECAFESRFNTFAGIDLEVTASGQGFIDRGRQNTWLNIFNDALCTITSTAVGCRIIGGAVDGISNSSATTDLDGVRYGTGGGVITNIGVTPRMRNVYSIVSAAFVPDQLIELKIGVAGATIKKHISLAVATGAWSVPVGVPGISKKDGIAFPGVVLGDTINIGCQSVIPEGYTLMAVATAADTVSLRMYQLYGAAASPFPAGATFRLDAWGH